MIATILLSLSLLTAFVPSGALFVLAADITFVGFVLADWLLTPKASRFNLDRELPETVGLSNEFERRVRLSTDSKFKRVYELELHEDFPDCFEVVERTDNDRLVRPEQGDPSGGPDRVWFDPESECASSRTYKSSRRGQFRVGDLRLAVMGPMGLIKRQERFAGSQSIIVESALANLRTTLALAASERWRDLGIRKRRRRGGQNEFESLRDYVRGDDVRMIDWKAFARRGKPTVRMFQEERGQELIVMFDCGRRMRSTASSVGAETVADNRWTKLDWAFDAGLQLAAVALQQGDRVGCVVFDDNVQAWVQPARGKRQFSRLREAVFGFQPSRRESNLSAALRELAVRHRRSATVAILSDVADPLSVDGQRRALSSSSRRHKIVFACLDDPEVRETANGGDALQFSETGSDLALRASAMQSVDERRLSLRELASSGARVLDALPADAAGPLLTAWLDARRSG